MLAAALLASMGTGYFTPADWSRGVAAHHGLARRQGGGGGGGGGGARRGRGGSGWEDKYLEEKLSEVKSKEEREKRRLAEADSEVEKEHAEESEGEGKKEIEVRELQRKVGELERKVLSGHLQSTQEQERALASAGEEVKSLEGRLQKLEAEEKHRRAADQAEHRRSPSPPLPSPILFSSSIHSSWFPSPHWVHLPQSLEPSTPNQQPSNLNRQPSTPNPKPQILNP